MTTVVNGDSKAARDVRRKQLLETLMELGSDDAPTLRDIVKELVDAMPTPALEAVVEQLTAKQDALGETVMVEPE